MTEQTNAVVTATETAPVATLADRILAAPVDKLTAEQIAALNGTAMWQTATAGQLVWLARDAALLLVEDGMELAEYVEGIETWDAEGSGRAASYLAESDITPAM